MAQYNLHMADVWHTFNTKVFWDVIPCSLAGGHSILCCDRTCCLRLQVKFV